MKNKIEIVNNLDRDPYVAVCDLGAETVFTVFRRMKELGIDPKNFGNVMAVAVGALASLGSDSESFGEAISIASKMWNTDGSNAEVYGLKYQAPEKTGDSN